MKKTLCSSPLKINKFFLVGFFLLFGSLAKSQPLSFEGLYQEAIKKSPELQQAHLSVQRAQADLEVSQAPFYPKLGVETRYESFESKKEKERGASSNLFLEWNLFDGFETLGLKKSSQADLNVLRISKERLDLNFKWILKAQYAETYALQEKVQAYKKIIQSNQKNVSTVKVRRSSGKVSESELLEFELFDSQLHQELISLEEEYLKARSDLESLTGRSPIGTLTPLSKPKKISFALLKSQLLQKTSPGPLSQIEESRLEVLAAEAKKLQSQGRFWPKVDLKATYGDMGIHETSHSPETYIGISAKWEFFSGLEDTQRKTSAQRDLEIKKSRHFQNQVSTKNRTEALIVKLEKLYDEISQDEKKQKQIQKFLSSSMEEYKRGFKSSADLKSALELVLESQVHQLVLKVDYYKSRVALQNILGSPLPEESH